MMSRHAEWLFWIGRYMERAENHSRLIDANYHMRHELRGNENDRDYIWEKLVSAVGDLTRFKENNAIANEWTVLHFLTFERTNSNSIYSIIHQSRNNIRALRQLLPRELWEIVNSLYLWLQDQDVNKLMQQSPYMFYQRVREWISLFYGAADSTMLREQEWNFLQAGKYLERAENTVRILQTIQTNLISDPASSQDKSHYNRMIVLLKSVGGYEAFRKSHADNVTFARVMEFLILNPHFPRSIQFAFASLESYLKEIRQEDFDFMELPNPGLRGSDLLHELLQSCNQLGISISKAFFQEEIVGA
ncbi:MAG: alpha-E domain-containing protein [Bacillota bacterium]